MLAGATLYGFSGLGPTPLSSWSYSIKKLANATEEFFVRKRPLYEVTRFVQ